MAIIRYTESFDADASYDPENDRAANGVPVTDPTHGYTLFANPDTLHATFRLRDDTTGETFDLGFLSRMQAAILADFSDQTAAVSLSGGALGDVLIGGSGNDTLNGGAGDDVLEGGAGGDQFRGGAGVNTVSYEHSGAGVLVLLYNNSLGAGGDARDDAFDNIQNLRGSAFGDDLRGDGTDNVIEGGGGADTLFGDYGTDTVSYAHSSAGVTVDFRTFDINFGPSAIVSGGDADGDSIYSFENIAGTVFGDVLIGNSLAATNDTADNILTGAAGDDVLEGMGGADTLDGGDGRDVASYADADAGVTASLADPSDNTGDAARDSYLGIEDLRGSAFTDTLTGDAGDNVIAPGETSSNSNDDADRVDGGAGRDTISYDGFASEVIIDFRNLVVLGPNKVLALFTGIENARGTAFTDVIIGDAGADVIEGGGRSDSLDGGGGRDTLSYRHSSAGVRVELTGADLGRGGDAEGDNFINFENLTGSDFADTLGGDTGNNRIEGRSGADGIDGMGGRDIASYAGSSAAVAIDLGAGTAAGGDAQGDTLTNIEGLVGSAFSDTLTGGANANYFRGGTGDTISGMDGNDRVLLVNARGAAIDGGAGARDVLIVQGDVDAFASLTGVEHAAVRAGGTLSLLGVDDGPTVIVSRGVVGDIVTITGGGADERIVAGEFDILHGSAGDDTIVAADRQQLVDGGVGQDTLRVAANADIDLFDFNFTSIETVVLGDGAIVRMGDVTQSVHAVLHSLTGGGADFSGTAAADAIVGGDGDDRIAGGVGSDVMRGGAGSDTFVFRELDEIAHDRIAGFVSGVDRIDVSEIDADGDATNGDTAFRYVGTGAFTGAAGEVHLAQSHGATAVQIDTDGDMTADLSFLVRGDAPVAGDFVL